MHFLSQFCMGGNGEQLDGRCQSNEPGFDYVIYFFSHRLLHTSTQSSLSFDIENLPLQKGGRAEFLHSRQWHSATTIEEQVRKPNNNYGATILICP
jgi:hypothetical protein